MVFLNSKEVTGNSPLNSVKKHSERKEQCICIPAAKLPERFFQARLEVKLADKSPSLGPTSHKQPKLVLQGALIKQATPQARVNLILLTV